MTQRGQRRTNRTDSATGEFTIDQQLVAEGIAQLASEIKVLENWLHELEANSGADSDTAAARKSYSDMLRSRMEMLTALNRHSRKSGLPS